MSLGKKKLVMNSFLALQLTIWMFYSTTNIKKITHFHERCLRLIYSGKSLCYEELLKWD